MILCEAASAPLLRAHVAETLRLGSQRDATRLSAYISSTELADHDYLVHSAAPTLSCTTMSTFEHSYECSKCRKLLSKESIKMCAGVNSCISCPVSCVLMEMSCTV